MIACPIPCRLLDRKCHRMSSVRRSEGRKHNKMERNKTEEWGNKDGGRTIQQTGEKMKMMDRGVPTQRRMRRQKRVTGGKMEWARGKESDKEQERRGETACLIGELWKVARCPRTLMLPNIHKNRSSPPKKWKLSHTPFKLHFLSKWDTSSIKSLTAQTQKTAFLIPI